METLDIARICHEANKSYCHSIGDHSQEHWHDAPKWQQDSAVSGVEFLLSHPKATSEDTHSNWLKEKIRDGWLYDEIKDPEKKRHPCIRDYCDLPVQQRAKDALFLGIVRSLAPYYSAERI